MKKLLVLLVATAGCATEEGSVIEIVGAPTATTSCTIAADSVQFTSTGLYDPTGPEHYTMTTLIQNNLRTKADDPATFNAKNVRSETDRVNLMGFDVCYFRADDPKVAAFKDERSGFLVDCADLPNSQREFIVESAGIAPGGGKHALFVELFARPVQQALFGANFDPQALVVGLERFDTNGDGDTTDPADFIVTTGVSSPEGAGRSAAWGTFPESVESTVVVQMRATGRTQTGRTVHSNWFAYPFSVCVGCINSACGDLTGDPGCSVPAVRGKLFTDAACLPYSGQTASLKCEAYTDCPD